MKRPGLRWSSPCHTNSRSLGLGGGREGGRGGGREGRDGREKGGRGVESGVKVKDGW